jgi:hypothetical protein
MCVMMVAFTVGVHGGRHWDHDGVPLERNDIVAATDYGLQKMNELVNVHEPHLYQLGKWSYWQMRGAGLNWHLSS